MPKALVFWAESARSDLFATVDALRASAPKRAVKLMAKLVNAAQQLADFPESGHRPLDITDDEHVRELVVEQFRLFYMHQPGSQAVQVIAVFHARRDVAELFKGRFG
jgi:plasmid stabilization system protein ParE